MSVFRHSLCHELAGVTGLAALAANILGGHFEGEDRQYENAAQKRGAKVLAGGHIPISYAEAE